MITNEQLLSITESPGVQYIVADDSGQRKNLSTGLASVADGKSVTADTTFNAYSLTKTVTATAVMQLVEKKLIALEDTVNPLFPEFSFSQNFTLRQLLSHQSGIGNPLPLRWVHLATMDDHFDEGEFTNETILKAAKLKFTPGAKMSYSNVGYMLLGLLIGKLSGSSYRAYVSDTILKKAVKKGYLGFSVHPQFHATGYIRKFSFANLLLEFMIDKRALMRPSSENKWAAFQNIQVNGSPYGGLIANAQGLAEYLSALLNHEILDENLTSQLFQEQKDGMCLGWFRGKLGGKDYVCHAGGGGGYYCEVRLYPQLKIASALATNVTGFTDKRLLDRLDIRTIG